jgi:hypothetical protein
MYKIEIDFTLPHLPALLHIMQVPRSSQAMTVACCWNVSTDIGICFLENKHLPRGNRGACRLGGGDVCVILELERPSHLLHGVENCDNDIFFVILLAVMIEMGDIAAMLPIPPEHWCAGITGICEFGKAVVYERN